MSFLRIFSVSLLQLFILSILVSRGTCALMDIRTSQAVTAQDVTLQFTHMSHRSQLVCCVENPSEVVPSFPLLWRHLLPNFQVIVPQVPVHVSIALQEEDLRATGWNPMPHQNRCTRYGLIQLCGSPRVGTVFQPDHRPRWCYDFLSRKDDTHKSRSIFSPRTFVSRGV